MHSHALGGVHQMERILCNRMFAGRLAHQYLALCVRLCMPALAPAAALQLTPCPAGLHPPPCPLCLLQLVKMQQEMQQLQQQAQQQQQAAAGAVAAA